MRCKSIIVLALSLGACAAKKGPEVCRPVSSWAAPTFRCAPITAATPPVETPVEPAPAPPPPEPKAEVIELRDRIQFETDSAVLLPQSKSVLDDVVTIMKDHPEITKVRIEGHTDSTSTPEHNQTLSEQRAASVKTYLVSKGIAGNRLTTQGFGQDKPVGDNGTEDGRFQNRRVEFHIVEKSK
jgi:OOP family OmpA-OmpF porin